jgi:hypothetical protein
VSEDNSPAPKNTSAGEAPQGEAPAATSSRRQQAGFFTELAARLPAPAYSSWSVGENLSVEEDLRAVIDLRAQPLLEVIKPLSQRKRDS